MKKISEFLPENFQFLVVKLYLNRHVFVMGVKDGLSKTNKQAQLFKASLA